MAAAVLLYEAQVRIRYGCIPPKVWIGQNGPILLPEECTLRKALKSCHVPGRCESEYAGSIGGNSGAGVERCPSIAAGGSGSRQANNYAQDSRKLVPQPGGIPDRQLRSAWCGKFRKRRQ